MQNTAIQNTPGTCSDGSIVHLKSRTGTKPVKIDAFWLLVLTLNKIIVIVVA